MGKTDRITGIFWLVFGVIVAIESYRHGLGTLRQPGPGFLFFWTSIVLSCMSLWVLFQGWAGKKRGEFERPIFGGHPNRKIPLVLISVILYALFMETIGFVPVTLLLFLFLLRGIERKSWVLAAFVSVAVTAASYLIFEIWLMAQLPRGLLDLLRF